MTKEKTVTPLWLDIKTEYIDGNIVKVIEYLHKGSFSPDRQDSFYSMTLSLLERRVWEMLERRDSVPIYRDGPETEDLSDAEFSVRLYGAFLLSGIKADAAMRLRVSVAFLTALMSLIPESHRRELLDLVLDMLTGRAELRLDWTDLTSLQPQVLAVKLVGAAAASNSSSPVTLWYEGRGSAEICAEGLKVAYSGRGDFARASLVPSFHVLDSRLQILAPKSDKLGQAESRNLDRLESFTSDYLREIRTNAIKSRRLKTYSVGDQLDVMVVGRSGGHLKVRSVSPEYETIEGELHFSQGVLYYTEADFVANLKDGQVIEATFMDENPMRFRLNQRFVDAVIEGSEEMGTMLAAVKEIKKDRAGKNKVRLWTEYGFPVYANEREDLPLTDGDIVHVDITGYGEGQYHGIINVNVTDFVASEEDADDETLAKLDEARTKADCIQWFVLPPEKCPDGAPEELMHGLLKDLSRMLLICHRELSAPSEKYAVLCFMRILSEVTGDEKDSAYLGFLSDYLAYLVHFARGEQRLVTRLEKPDGIESTGFVETRVKLASILAAYGDESGGDLLEEILENEDDQLLRRVAVLVQAANRIQDVVSKSVRNVIKREIVSSLSLATEESANLEEDNGEYLGMENARQEFKTSFFTAPQNAREQRQPLNIMKGICAFLNSQEGGTLYIGVNDMGYVCGIAEDLRHLETKINGNYYGIDGFVRYITDYMRKIFSLNIVSLISVRPMYGGRVVAISVPPYEYDIVRVDGSAYIRINSESVKMTDFSTRSHLSRKLMTDRDKEQVIMALKEAIADERKVVLHGYSSSSSGTVGDRNVEPFSFCPGYAQVWCYDVDKQRNAVFSTSRIRNVEILDRHWTYRSSHREGVMDIFRMSGEKPVHIVLGLNLRAKNILSEEYPDSRKVLVPTEDPDRWLLDTEVYSMKGVGRFYLGLASCIEIIDAPELVAYVRDYVAKHLTTLLV